MTGLRSVGMVSSWTGVLGRLVLLVAVPAAVLLTGSAPALAHAVLVESDPADGATLEAPPDEVSLRFNEPVEAVDGGVRLHDANATRVDDGVRADGRDGTVALALPDALPDGGYLLVYRVISADGHPVSGVVGFTVGAGAAVDDAVAADLLRGDTAAGTVGALLRGVTYLGTLLAAGAVAFALLVGRRADDRRRAQRLGAAAAAVALAATLVALPVQAMALAGVGPLEALSPSVAAETLRTAFGQSWLVRVAALGLLAPLLRRGRPLWALLGAAAAAPASFLLDGHTRSMEPGWLLVAGDAVHLGAAAIWFGGLVLLALAVRSRSLDDDPIGAAHLVARFSGLALGTVVALTVSGAAMGWALVRTPGALTSTGYGWTLLAKVALVALAVAVAAYNRQRLVPAVAARAVPAGGSVDRAEQSAQDRPASADAEQERRVRRSRAAWRQLRTTLGVEALLLVAVLLVTGFLVVQRPAADAAGVTGLYDTRVAMTDELDLEVVVDPNRAGETNAIHLYALDATGRPAGEVEEVRLELHYAPEDIGPFTVEPFPAGPGHWIANVDELTFAGEWRLTVIAGVDRFTEERVELTVPVR
jgi:copper transport protein